MIEILNPGILSLIVDTGRLGYGALGVPPSSVMDGLAYGVLCRLLGRRDIPTIEAMGANFGILFHSPLSVGITGARVRATINDAGVEDWSVLAVRPGDVLRIREVVEGLRYYIGFSGVFDLEPLMDSYTTNLDCCFGGLEGRPLKRGDRLPFREIWAVLPTAVPRDAIPSLAPPHLLHFLSGPERHLFTEEGLKGFSPGHNHPYTVSRQSNRTGIRLEGPIIPFHHGVEKSILSEGLLPGTIQVPGDSRPIIVLSERTVGGYARLGVICHGDLFRLAHLRSGDTVYLEEISPETAARLRQERQRISSALCPPGENP